MTTNCEACNKNPRTKTVSCQTIPGSLDTKFFDVEMCEKCYQQYCEFMDYAWDGWKDRQADELEQADIDNTHASLLAGTGRF